MGLAKRLDSSLRKTGSDSQRPRDGGRRAAAYRDVAPRLVQAVQGQLQVRSSPRYGAGAGHVEQFGYYKRNETQPNVSLGREKNQR